MLSTPATFNLDMVPSELRSAAEKDLQRFTGSLGSNPSGALREQFLRAFVGSEFVANHLIVKPELLGEILELVASADSRPLDCTALLPLAQACASEIELDQCLREFRLRAMLQILWQDFNAPQSRERYDATVAAVSTLAETSIQVALDFHYDRLVERYGVPIGRESGLAQHMVVLGMGKLGASELNVSSDIDLIFAYPESGATVHDEVKRKTLSNQEFFVRLGQRLIKSLDAVTAHGFVFRVDMRLRPYGQSGALTLNFDAMEDYYQTQGRDWERFAMIKARPVAGDAVAGRQLMALLQPFTYRKYIDFSAIDALRSTKALINREVQRKGITTDLKLGFGGIREIEFIVQAFQLIRGGRDERLRDPRVCHLLPLLEAEGYLPEGSASALLDAYILLRNAEHAVQGFQDRQTQALPVDSLGEARMAWVLGFENWASLHEKMQGHRERVNREFQAVIAEPESAHLESDVDLQDWDLLWLGELESAQVGEYLGLQESEDIAAVMSLLANVRDSRTVAAMQASGRERLERFMPCLLSSLLQTVTPSSLTQTLTRIMTLVEAVLRRSAYLVLLIENPKALQQLVQLCAASPWIADQLATHPALLDELLDARTLYSPPGKQQLQDELRQDTLRLAWDDLEGHMDTLRHFRQAHALRVAASEVSGILPLMRVSDYLTYIAEVVLEHVLALAWEQLTAKHGCPRRVDGSACLLGSNNSDFIVVAYGKLGGIELGHGSDLDLVFIHDADTTLSTDGERSIDNQTFYTRLGQRMIHIMTARMASGELYEVDMRLRPSGNSGLLVSSLAAFEKYQMNEAWVWEHQALVRARVVAGSPELGERFNAVRASVLTQPRALKPLVAEVISMRKKMREHLGSQSTSSDSDEGAFHLKQDAGGIVDIEFMVQYAVLAWANKEPSLVHFTDNIRILGALESLQFIGANFVVQLVEAYKAYRSTGHRLTLQGQSLSVDAEQFSGEREAVIQLWQQLLPAEIN